MSITDFRNWPARELDRPVFKIQEPSLLLQRKDQRVAMGAAGRHGLGEIKGLHGGEVPRRRQRRPFGGQWSGREDPMCAFAC